jgi:hypothetical protein
MTPMRLRAAAFVALALGALPVAALEDTGWPPPPEVLGRMRDLQAKIGDPNSTKEERDAARSELSRLLKGPAASDKPQDSSRPARAAIDPFPGVVKPIEDRMPPIPAPPTARLEVIPDPPRAPVVSPSTGRVIHPSGPGVAVDPRTGNLLHETPSGYVDPRTGRFTPK